MNSDTAKPARVKPSLIARLSTRLDIKSQWLRGRRYQLVRIPDQTEAGVVMVYCWTHNGVPFGERFYDQQEAEVHFGDWLEVIQTR